MHALLLSLLCTLYPFPEGEIAHQTKPDPFPMWSGKPLLLPVGKSVREKICEKAPTLEEKLNKHIFGQERAVRETANALVRYAAGLHEPDAPIATLLYCGPSGVGKTELAKQLTEEIYGTAGNLIRINMTEFVEETSISRLIGSSPGYIGHEKGGALSNRLLDSPHAVVLLDEIEKAHPKVFKLFMHLFDTGKFTSAKGEEVDCRETLFILTSNLAAEKIAQLFDESYHPSEILEQIQPELMESLSPELFNRLECVLFSPLSYEAHKHLTQKLLDELCYRVYCAQNIRLIFHDSILEHLLEKPLDPQLGARPLKRLIQRELATTLAKAFLESAAQPDDILLCAYTDGYLTINTITHLFQEKNK